MSSTAIGRPVGSTPNRVPVCVPVTRQRTNTPSPSPAVASTSMSQSSHAANCPFTYSADCSPPLIRLAAKAHLRLGHHTSCTSGARRRARLIMRTPNRSGPVRPRGQEQHPSAERKQALSHPPRPSRGRPSCAHVCHSRAELRGLRTAVGEPAPVFPDTSPVASRQRSCSCATMVFCHWPYRLPRGHAGRWISTTRPAAPLPKNSQLSARREGPGWLVVFGGTGKQRAQLLSVHRVSGP